MSRKLTDDGFNRFLEWLFEFGSTSVKVALTHPMRASLARNAWYQDLTDAINRDETPTIEIGAAYSRSGEVLLYYIPESDWQEIDDR